MTLPEQPHESRPRPVHLRKQHLRPQLGRDRPLQERGRLPQRRSPGARLGHRDRFADARQLGGAGRSRLGNRSLFHRPLWLSRRTPKRSLLSRDQRHPARPSRRRHAVRRPNSPPARGRSRRRRGRSRGVPPREGAHRSRLPRPGRALPRPARQLHPPHAVVCRRSHRVPHLPPHGLHRHRRARRALGPALGAFHSRRSQGVRPDATDE